MPNLTLPATLESLQTVFSFIEATLPARFSAQKSNIELVAEELLVNVFSYAYPEGHGMAEIMLEEAVGENAGLLAFRVKDWGNPFNPFSEAPDPDLTSGVESRPIGGLGIFLIRQLTEKQTYRYENSCNVIDVFFAEQPKKSDQTFF